MTNRHEFINTTRGALELNTPAATWPNLAVYDKTILESARELLIASSRAPSLIPAERDVLLATASSIWTLPQASLDVAITIAGQPTSVTVSGDSWRIFRSRDIELSATRIDIISGGVIRSTGFGGGSFEAVRWAWEFGSSPQLCDNRAGLFGIPPIPTLARDLARMDVAGGGYVIDVTNFRGDILPSKSFGCLLCQ